MRPLISLSAPRLTYLQRVTVLSPNAHIVAVAGQHDVGICTGRFTCTSDRKTIAHTPGLQQPCSRGPAHTCVQRRDIRCSAICFTCASPLNTLHRRHLIEPAYIDNDFQLTCLRPSRFSAIQRQGQRKGWRRVPSTRHPSRTRFGEDF